MVEPELENRTATRARVGLLAAVAVLVAVGHYWYGNRNRFYDLGIYRSAMKWWADGHPLYEFTKPDETMGQLGYTYPPFAAWLMRPLAWIGLVPAQLIYVLLTLTVGALMVWWLSGPLAERLRQPRWFVAGLLGLLASGLEPIRETYSFGQINLLLAFLILLDLLILAPRGSRFTGVGIGLATAIKLVPGIFILYLIVSRRWRAAAVATGTALAATGLAALISWDDTRTYWTEQVIGADGVGKLDYTFNQSLMGVLARLTDGDPNRALWLLLALPVLVFGMWRAGRAALAGDEVAGLALAGLTGSLISPVTWVHHIVWFVPALVVLARSGTAHRALAAFVYLTVTFSLVANWEFNFGQPGGVVGFLLSNWDVWLMLTLLVALPTRAQPSNYATMPEKSALSQIVPAAP